MRIVIAPFDRINDTTLAAVRAAGHEVVCSGISGQSYSEIEAQYPVGWRPDVFIFWSPEYNPIPLGLEGAPCFKVGVFGDWNLGGQAVQQVAGMFDLLFADRNGADRLRDLGFEDVRSAPLWSWDPQLHKIRPDVVRDIDILLVGNFNPDIQRERAPWLARIARLSSRYSVVLESGVFGEAYVQLLNRAKIVFNRSIRGEINMRVYEAPACGALLFYERENREIRDLFVDHRECVLYGDDDLEQLIDYYLANPVEREAVAAAGWRRVQSETPALHILAMCETIESAMNQDHRGGTNAFASLPEWERDLRRVRQWLLSSSAEYIPAAVEALERAERAGADRATVLSLRGYLLAQAGKVLPAAERAPVWASALQAWRLAVDTRPSSASARINLAFLLIETGQGEKAEAQARAALRMLDGDANAALNEGDLFWPCRFTAFGVEYDRIEISHRQGDDGWRREMHALLRWRALELLANLLYAEARFAEAAEAAAAASGLMPHVGGTRFIHGRALNAVGRLDSAAAEYRAALRSDPFLWDARRALAQLYVDSCRPRELSDLLDEWSDIVRACPPYANLAAEFAAFREQARSLLPPSGGAARGARLLAFPDWRRAESWQSLLAGFAATVASRDDLLMLWADPDREQPASILSRIAKYCAASLRLEPAEFPNVTVVSHAFAPHERWKLFCAATAVVQAGDVPHIFSEAFAVSGLPSIALLENSPDYSRTYRWDGRVPACGCCPSHANAHE